MKEKIIALTKAHLEYLIENEINENGPECDLNHIDVSQITSMRGLFFESFFIGDISQWDVSNVEDMSFMFNKSIFNGDISNWNVSKVKDMSSIFYDSEFRGDISKWKPYSLTSYIGSISKDKQVDVFWVNYSEPIERNKAIDAYWLEKELQEELETSKVVIKKTKI
jgi:surface protein